MGRALERQRFDFCFLAFVRNEALPRPERVGSEAASELLKGLQAENGGGGVPDIQRSVGGGGCGTTDEKTPSAEC